MDPRWYELRHLILDWFPVGSWAQQEALRLTRELENAMKDQRLEEVRKNGT